MCLRVCGVIIVYKSKEGVEAPFFITRLGNCETPFFLFPLCILYSSKAIHFVHVYWNVVKNGIKNRFSKKENMFNPRNCKAEHVFISWRIWLRFPDKSSCEVSVDIEISER